MSKQVSGQPVCVYVCVSALEHMGTQVCVAVCSERCLWDIQGWRERDQEGKRQAVTEEERGCIRKRDRMGLEGEGLREAS